jgi:hypothetical protein
MKFRQDYVTNSSSASYIICFARVADKEKAQKIIDTYHLDAIGVVCDADYVEREMTWGGWLGADWAGAYISGVDDIINEHPDDQYIIIEDTCDGHEIDYDEVEYFYDFVMNDAINDITEANGFADIGVAEGEGRNG